MCLLTRLFPLRFYTVSSYKDKNKVETKTGFFTSKWVNNKSFVVPPTRGSELSIPQAICKASLTILTNLDYVLHYDMIAICYDISKEICLLYRYTFFNFTLFPAKQSKVVYGIFRSIFETFGRCVAYLSAKFGLPKKFNYFKIFRRCPTAPRRPFIMYVSYMYIFFTVL